MVLEDKKIKKGKIPHFGATADQSGVIFRIPDLLNKKSINEKSIENKNDKFFQCCFLVFVNFVNLFNFWAIFGQFFSSPNKKLLFSFFLLKK